MQISRDTGEGNHHLQGITGTTGQAYDYKYCTWLGFKSYRFSPGELSER